MTLKRFRDDDIYHNVVIAHPDIEFFVNDGNVYYNREVAKTGNHSNNINHVPQGYISLYEQNIDRPSDGLITRFITKETTRGAFRTVSTTSFQDFAFGDTITDTYPISASISRIYIPSGIEFGVHTFESDLGGNNLDTHNNKKYIRALKNYIDFGQRRGTEFKYGDKGTRNVNLICVPSIFYGSEIKKNSLKLNYYITGTLTATLEENLGNGELVQTYGIGSGSVAGILLREQGIAILTGSWALNESVSARANFFGTGLVNSSWLNFGSGIDEVGTTSGQVVGPDHSYLITCKGTNKIPTLTMLAHAEYNEMNFSNNPTFLSGGFIDGTISSGSYFETESSAQNIKKSNYPNHYEDYEKITYISKVGIYDEYKNLIAIATLSNPIKKTEKLDYTVKLKLDF